MNGVVDIIAVVVAVAVEVMAFAKHPPVCHCKYRRRLIVDEDSPLELAMPCDSSSPTSSSDDDLMLPMINMRDFCVAVLILSTLMTWIIRKNPILLSTFSLLSSLFQIPHERKKRSTLPRRKRPTAVPLCRSLSTGEPSYTTK